jgi:hypothetical protein
MIKQEINMQQTHSIEEAEELHEEKIDKMEEEDELRVRGEK